MFDLALIGKLLLNAFSFERGSLRFPTPKRLFSVLVVLPSILILVFVNRICMALDHVFFYRFREQELSNAAFIVGVPRSATTYLYDLLAKDKTNFTCFKLWEILFAPSIMQKHFYAVILLVDRAVGRPVYRLSLLFDRLFLSKISRLHEFSLSKPEEDEMILVHAFATVYLMFLFPDVRALDPYLFFDVEMSAKKRRKIMDFYKGCVRRHVYFHDRAEKKMFLSKNPGFVSKTMSLAETFPQSRLIYMLRSPLKTIPSTISLSKNLYSVFSGEIKTNPLAHKTLETVVQWYKMADFSISSYWQGRSITVPFAKITRGTSETVLAIYDFLQRVPASGMQTAMIAEQQKSRTYKTTHAYPGVESEGDLVNELDFIFQGPYRDEIYDER